MAPKKLTRSKEGEQSYRRRALFADDLDDEEVKTAFLAIERGTILREVKSRALRPPVRVHLSSDHEFIIFKTPKQCFGGGKLKRIPVSIVLDVRSGWNTDRFIKASSKNDFNAKVSEGCCFSVIFRKLQHLQKSVDLVTETPEEQKLWVIALRRLLLDTRAAALHFNEENWLRKHFQAADVNNNGKLSFNELWELLKKLNVQISEKECKRQFLLNNINKTDDEDVPVFDFDELVLFFRSLTKRAELKRVMRSFSEQEIDMWTAQDLKKFLEVSQGFQVTLDACKAIIQEYEPDNATREQGHLSVHGFRLLLLSKWGSVMNPLHANTVFQDMTQPLCEYFINSTHNTYLLGHQLRGDATIEGYIHALKTGARLLELDIWEGDHDHDHEPVVTHGYTLVNPMPLVNVVRAIDSYAFVASPYPLILSLENHCGLEAQRRVAHIFSKIFGDKIYVPPSSQTVLPSPGQLLNKILLKCKKLSDSKGTTYNPEDEFFDDVYDAVFGFSDGPVEAPAVNTTSAGQIFLPDVQPQGDAMKAKKKKEKVPIAQEFSDLIALKSVKLSELKRDAEEHPWNSHASQTESKAKDSLTDEFDMVMYYTSRHLMKVYPSGKRTGSTNMHPTKYWMAGIQQVTMNAQTAGEELDLNNGWFSINDSCGYVLKPKWMREGVPRDYYNLMRRNTKMTLRVQIISAQCLPRPDTKYSESIVDPYVTLEIFGFPIDNQKHRTAVVQNNGFNPVWNSEHFVINLKVPETALLRFCAKDYDRMSANDFIGQYSIPVMSVTQGYSHIPLLTGTGHTRDPSAALFVHIDIDCFLTEEELTNVK